jgi:hypothetical protein
MGTERLDMGKAVEDLDEQVTEFLFDEKMVSTARSASDDRRSTYVLPSIRHERRLAVLEDVDEAGEEDFEETTQVEVFLVHVDGIPQFRRQVGLGLVVCSSVRVVVREKSR